MGAARVVTMDYAAAARRHWRDAGLLEAHERWPNADQLLGQAAECALKAIALEAGFMKMKDDKPEPEKQKHRTHIDMFWSEFLFLAQGRALASAGARLEAVGSAPFADWHIAQRYAGDDVTDAPHVSRHRVAASACCRLLDRWQLGGVC